MTPQQISPGVPAAGHAAPADPLVLCVFQTGQRSNGGVESATQLLSHMPQRCTVLTQAVTEVNDRWLAAGHEVKVLDAPFAVTGRPLRLRERLARVLGLVRGNLAAWRLLRRGAAPVIHCNDAAAFWHTRVGAALAGAGVVYNVRDTMDPEAFTGLRRLKWRLKFAIAHEVVVLSSEMKDFYVRHLRLSPAAARRIVAIPSIVEHLPLATAPVRRRLRDEFGLSPDVFAFGYVATFSPKKGQLEFLSKAAPVLKAGEGKVRCIFIGDFDVDNNAYARRCQQLIEGMGLQQVVECRGSTSRMADWYCALDGVVLASRYEGLARCMIEGMAAGLPVVSFDVCSARETLEASSAGVVVEQGDFERLAQELLRLAEDPKTAFAMGQAGLAYARRVFEADAVAEAYRQVYARTAGRQAA